MREKLLDKGLKDANFWYQGYEPFLKEKQKSRLATGIANQQAVKINLTIVYHILSRREIHE